MQKNNKTKGWRGSVYPVPQLAVVGLPSSSSCAVEVRDLGFPSTAVLHRVGGGREDPSPPPSHPHLCGGTGVEGTLLPSTNGWTWIIPMPCAYIVQGWWRIFSSSLYFFFFRFYSFFFIRWFICFFMCMSVCNS